MQRAKFLNSIGGTRFLAVLILLWAPYMTSLIWGFVLAAAGKPDWTALKAMTVPVMGAFAVFVSARTAQHIKLDEKGM